MTEREARQAEEKLAGDKRARAERLRANAKRSLTRDDAVRSARTASRLEAKEKP